MPPAWQGLFDYGIGIHFGPALVGNVGGTERLDYMVLGDVINTTARIESLTKLYGVRLLVTRQVRSKLSRPPPARMLDRVIPKGKTEALELWEPAHSLSPVNFASLTDHYAAAWGLYEAGKFLEASAAFAALARDFSDPPSRTMAARCQEFVELPLEGAPPAPGSSHPAPDCPGSLRVASGWPQGSLRVASGCLPVGYHMA